MADAHSPASGPALLEIGRIGKAHGLAGQVLVRLTTNVEDRLVPGVVLTPERPGAVPLVVLDSKRHQDRWIVTFEGVGSRQAAEALTGTVLLAEPLEHADDPDVLWIHELIGAEVVDRAGVSHGSVTAVLDNPASDILELANGRLVPLTFVVEHSPTRLVVDAPPGILTDLD